MKTAERGPAKTDVALKWMYRLRLGKIGMPHPSLSLRRDFGASCEHATATSPFPHSSSKERNPGRNTQRGNNEANDKEEAEERGAGLAKGIPAIHYFSCSHLLQTLPSPLPFSRDDTIRT